MAYYVLPSEKVGGHVPRVPHQIAPMFPMYRMNTPFPYGFILSHRPVARF